MRKYTILFFLFLITPTSFWQCTPENPSPEIKSIEDIAPEGGNENRPEPLPELVAEPTPFEPTVPDGPHEVDTLKVDFTFPPNRYTGDVKAVIGTAQSQGPAIAKLEISIQNNVTGLYWDGKAFAELDAAWNDLPQKDSFHFDTSTIPFQEGGYTAYIRASDEQKGYKVFPLGWISGLPWNYLANNSPWRYLSGPLDGEFFVQGQRGIVYRVREKGAFRIPLGIGPIFATYPFQDPKLMLMAGAQGKIWRTTDGGTIWQALDHKLQKLSDIQSLSASKDEKIIIAGAQQGRIYRSDDSGETWSAQSETRGENIRHVCRIADQQWVALSDQGAGSAIYRSDAGGNNWSSVTLPITDRRFFGMYCAEQDKIILLVGDEGKILRSEDSGATWTDQSDISITTDLRGVWRDSNKTWWLVGASSLVLSSSDGKAFQTVSGPTADSPTLWDIRLEADGKKGFAWGELGTWWSTEDAGKTWKPLLQPIGPQQKRFNQAKFPLGPRYGFAISEAGIFATEDAGQTWQEKHKGGPYYGSWMKDNQVGIFVGSEICRTEDAGTQWNCQPLGVDGPLYSVSFSNETNGCAVGAKGALLCSSDAGRSWQQGILSSGETMRQIFFINQETAYIVGDKGNVFRSKDNGKNWLPVKIDLAKDHDLYSVSFPLNDDVGYIGGSGGLLLKTEDFGTTWTAVDLKTTEDVRFIHFPLNLSEGYLLVGAYDIYHTDDGGKTWNKLPSLSTIPLLHLNFSQSTKLGFATGEDGTILLTRDGFQ